MEIAFENVSGEKKEHILLLYQLLEERTPEVNISHKKMPTMEEHIKFVSSHPYRLWQIINWKGKQVGAAYLTHQFEMAVFLLREFQDLILPATKGFIEKVKPITKQIAANVNPKNGRYIQMFESLGFKHIQNTYMLS